MTDRLYAKYLWLINTVYEAGKISFEEIASKWNVGEAAYMLTKTFKNAHPATPWKFVQGMRHVLVHDYATIDDRELYNTAVNDIPILI